MIIIKVTFNQDTRRIAVERLMPFYALKQLVRNMFPVLQESDKDISLKYIDDEGDIISLSTDFELDEAHRQADGSPKVLRLQVQVATSSAVLSESDLLEFTVSDFRKEDKPAVDAPTFSPAETSTLSTETSEPISSSSSSAAAATAATSAPSVRADVPVLQVIESQLVAAMKTISTFMDSLHIDQKLAEMIADIQTNMKKATVAAQENVLNPLSAMTKSKAAVAADHLDKLKVEIAKLKALLEVEFNNAIDKIAQLASSQPPAQPQPPKKDVELTEVSAKPVEPSVAAQVSAAPTEPVSQPPENIGAQLVNLDLQHLADMGFTDRARNLELLAKFNGDMALVVEHLIR